MFTKAELDHYRTEGYCIVDDMVSPDMLGDLQDAARRVKKKVRSGQVDIYTHWADPGEPWAIRGLLAREFDESTFAEYLLSDPVMARIEPVLGEELRLGGVLLFTNPYHKDSASGWHRDFGSNPREGSYDVEMEVLNRPLTRLKWHLALVDDACLSLVPGSQSRYRTESEQAHLMGHATEDIAGQKVIRLKAGQTCFWNGNTIHRGLYSRNTERLTLAGSWSQYDPSGEPAPVDSRMKWMLADTVSTALPECMRTAYDRWRGQQIDN